MLHRCCYTEKREKPSDERLADSYWTGASTYLNCHVVGGNPSVWNLTGDADIQNETTKIMILVDDKFVRTKSGTLAAGKCYLNVSSYSSLAREFFIDDEGEITEIEEVEAKRKRMSTTTLVDDEC